MGNIRPSFIKIRAIRLCEEHGEKFTEDFDHNKLMVSELTDVSSKKLRNWIAGYVTRLPTAPNRLKVSDCRFGSTGTACR